MRGWFVSLLYSRPSTVNLFFFCACSLQCTLSSAAQCIVIGPVCGFVCVFVFVGLLPCTITRNCDNSKLRASILKVKVVTSDHLQLIKFWPSRNPGKGVCGGAKIFGSALLQPARSLCVSLGAFSLCLFHSSMFFVIMFEITYIKLWTVWVTFSGLSDYLQPVT